MHNEMAESFSVLQRANVGSLCTVITNNRKIYADIYYQDSMIHYNVRLDSDFRSSIHALHQPHTDIHFQMLHSVIFLCLTRYRFVFFLLSPSLHSSHFDSRHKSHTLAKNTFDFHRPVARVVPASVIRFIFADVASPYA